MPNPPIKGPHSRSYGSLGRGGSVALQERREQSAKPDRETGHLVRAISHDMTAIFMLLDNSFGQLKQMLGHRRQKMTRAQADSAGKAVAERVTHVEACMREAKRFLGDLAMLARTGSVQMDPERVELSDVVADVLFEQREPLAARGMQVDVAAGSPAVWCNAARAKQVFTNLVHNAIMHGCDPHDPRIMISHRRRPGSDGAPLAEITVHDNGSGIPAESRAEVFLPGRRLPTAHPEGTGMGLSIVKKIVDYYGGEVFVDPACPQGTAIVFTLPLPPA
ncbi:MAG TPA: HAMP domain-containing sensor histidine kinase [Pirellulales bacterium]|jgi:signal transduction histidine kinase|nr:HAMP domain-containing sensor histidine kinase [Pirellulales bacterium]